MGVQTHRRRYETRKLVEHMLREREEMLVLLWKVSGRDGDPIHKPDPDLVKRFLAILVDYIASAHFGLYQRLAEGTERRRAVVDKAAEVYPRIIETTDAVMAFNDKYGERVRVDKELAAELSALAERLVDRIADEDQVIEAMLGVPVESITAG